MLNNNSNNILFSLMVFWRSELKYLDGVVDKGFYSFQQTEMKNMSVTREDTNSESLDRSKNKVKKKKN